MPAVTSAAGLLTLLEDDNDELKQYALVNLDKVVHEYWYQISASIASVEALYEDEDFRDRELAALIASKVFYHLGELDSALTYALGAGKHFDINEQTEYVQTLVARCLDQYFAARARQVEGGQEVTLDPRLVAVVERMVDWCCSCGQYEQAVGFALEGRRLDLLQGVIRASGARQGEVLRYALAACQRLLVNREFRQQVLRLLIHLYKDSAEPDWAEVCQCLMFLDDAPEVASILQRLIQGTPDDVLLAYQIAFDLVENEMQSFLLQVQELLPKPAAPAAEANGDAVEPAAAGGDAMDTDAPAAPAAAAAEANGNAPAAAPAVPGLSGEAAEALVKLRDILSGKMPIALSLEFLYHSNKADLGVLKAIKGSVDARNSVCHGATVLANALMHAGTSIDTFLRENLDWLGRATNWSKFSATAGLGAIHRGQLQQARALMAPYLPREGAPGSQYSEGGALYALGLITANHGAEMRDFLLTSLRNAGANKPAIHHGGCLGLGLAALGTSDEEIFEEMKNVLYADDAVEGEAAGIGMGLLCCGSGSDRADEMLAYAHDTQHEKIIRGLALGLALICYGREEAADPLIDQLAADADPILRYGAMYCLGLAYRATGNNAAIQRLLHFAVSDVSDDVRRAAVLCLGFVLMNTPEQCPKIVSLLAESFNPHVRYGAAMAVGLACAGTGNREAVLLLEGMLGDSVDIVRQGVVIALALVLLQQPESKVGPFRKRLLGVIGDKHEEVMARMGAIMAAGILDAGGRNVTIGLRSRSGYVRRTSVVGLAVFTGYWYWYPLSYFLSLAFQPTACIGVDASLRTPVLPLECHGKRAAYAYAAPLTQEAVKEVTKVEKAVLSTTAKAKERQKKKEAEKEAAAGAKGEAGTSAGGDTAAAKAEGDAATAMETDDKAAAPKEAAKEEEGPCFRLEAPCRVTPAQVAAVKLPPGSRWVPVRAGAPLTGILVLRDTQPDTPVEYASSAAAAGPGNANAPGAAGAAAAGAAAAAGEAAPKRQEAEPAPPEPFELDEA